MKKLFAALSLTFLAACSTVKAPEPSLKEAHLAKAKAARAHAVAQLYSPTCPAPAYYRQDHCGLENESFTADLQKFTVESCAGVAGAECEAKFAEKVIPRWQARYPRANVAEIANWCKERLKDCHNLSLQELRWMDSHNQNVLAELEASLENVKRETRLAYEEKRRAVGSPSLTASAKASTPAALTQSGSPSLNPAPATIR